MIRIAIFGAPVSGKSKTAHALAKLLRAKIIEASREVLYPLVQKIDILPREEVLIKNFAKYSNKNYPEVSRPIARQAAMTLRKKFSPDFIAKVLHALYVDQPKYQKIIFTGLRGLDNARYLRLHNDFVVCLKADKQVLIDRFMKKRGYTREAAVAELATEEKMFHTSKIEKIANLVVDTSRQSNEKVCQIILEKIEKWNQMCKLCVNTARNPAITFDQQGLCNICSAYLKNFDSRHLEKELQFLESFKNSGAGKYDVLVGISGGKDSTATLYTVKQMGFKPLAVTFNLGYLPATTIPRARTVAKLLKTDFELIDIRKYIRPIDLKSYQKTVALYEEPFSLETKLKFQHAYKVGREHYSVRCQHSPIFVRSCQLCRRMVVRAYYDEALKRGVRAIILGINEWTNLSAAQAGRAYRVSGLRKLQPTLKSPPVYVFHLPFLLQRNSRVTKKILKKIKWQPPRGEDFVESNSNSCLYARSTERQAKRLLEFHPDSTRLAREVTVGFITKKEALKALGKIHSFKYTPRQVLERARIFKKNK